MASATNRTAHTPPSGLVPTRRDVTIKGDSRLMGPGMTMKHSLCGKDEVRFTPAGCTLLTDRKASGRRSTSP